ncbi:sigma 54-interacting transcriptional regulator [Microvirga thermotolerans]|nr:sigma 54-interacting transcriptional regulator [Microvirga thermotolerans]
MPLHEILAHDIRSLRRGEPGHVRHPESLRAIRLADKAARGALPVLIAAEPGSGATALARAIHMTGPRKGRPFVILRCDGAPGGAEACDAALEKGLREARGGTLCVEDAERLPAAAQARLRDALGVREQTRRVPRSDARIVATTGAALDEEVRRGRFREDLYYRLQIQPIVLRPLRAEPGLAADWARVFMRLFAREEGRPVAELTPEALDLLRRYDWPGNLRQLENAVFRAVALAEGPALTPAEFPQIAARAGGGPLPLSPRPGRTFASPPPDAAPPRQDLRDPGTLSLVGEGGELRTLAELEAEAIRFALTHYSGRMSAISRRLGIGRSTLYRKLKELGLDHEAA